MPTTAPPIVTPSPNVWSGGSNLFPQGTLNGAPCYVIDCAPFITGGAVPCPCPLVSSKPGGGTSPTSPPSPPPPSPPPSPPPEPLPPPPPGCVISSDAPLGYSATSYDPPGGVVSLTGDLASQWQGSYPYYVLWLPNGSQLGYVDLSGSNRPPVGPWYYEGTTTTTQLFHSNCTVYAATPLPPPPPPKFPGCDDTVYLAIPLVGSEEWCRVQTQILQAVRQIGIDVFGFLNTQISGINDTFYDWRNSAELKNCGITNLFDCLIGGLKWLGGAFGGAITGTLRQIMCWIGNGALRSDTCDPLTYGSLIAMKCLWHAIKNADVGSQVWIFITSKLGEDTTIPIIDRVLEYLIETVCPTEIPYRAEIISAFLANRIQEPQYNCWMAMRGHSPVVWKPILDSEREQVSSLESIEWIRRQDLGDVTKWNPGSPYVLAEADIEAGWYKQSLADLRNLGWLYEEDAGAFVELYDELPTIAQHLHWLARNVDDASYVAQYNLLDGFSSAADCANILGVSEYTPLPQVGDRNFWATFGAELRAQGMRKIDAAREYAAHWLNASPIQLREFMYRLRPDRQLKDWEASVAQQLGLPGVTGGAPPPQFVFTTTDFTKLLSEQDYSPRNVTWFAATQFHVPALSYLRDMFRFSVITSDDLAGYHRDLGYSPEDSDRFVSVDTLIKNRIRMQEAHAWNPVALSNALALGMITADQDKEWMQYLGFNDDEIKAHQDASSFLLRSTVLRRAMSYSVSKLLNQTLASYQEGIPTHDGAKGAIVGLGVPADRAEGMLAVADTTRLTSLTKQTKSSLKRAYMQGLLSKMQLIQLLSGLMQNGDVVQATVDAWTVQQLANSKVSSKAEVKKYLREGLISLDDAKTRLENLNIRSDDVQLLLDEVNYLEQEADNKAQIKQQKQADQQQKQAQAQADKLAKEIAREQAAATKAATAADEKAARAEAAALAKTAREEAQAMRLAQTQARREAADLVRGAKQADSLRRKIIAALQKDEPVSQLNKWAALSLIDFSYYHTRMNLYGYSDESIQLQWDTACSKPGASCTTAASPGSGVLTSADASAAAGATTAAVTAEESAVTGAEAQQNQSGATGAG